MKHFILLAAFLTLAKAAQSQTTAQTGSLALSPNFVAQAQTPNAPYVWWEAEKPSAGNFNRNPSDNPRVREVMSGGTWIGFEEPFPTEKAFLEYQIEVPRAGEWEFLARKFWHHGPFRWRFDDQPWRVVDNTFPLLDTSELWTHWGANWVPTGTVNLSKGRHTLRIELLENKGVAYFDAFVLTQEPFKARGKLKPDAPYPPAPQGWFNFSPAFDDASPAALDLRGLNEKTAGEKGWVRAKGEQLVGGDGKPVRFWAMNINPQGTNMPRAYVDRMARFLAKRGVNMVRIHGANFIQSGPNAGKINERYMDNLLYAISAFQKQGIYTNASIYFPLWIDLSQSTEFPGYKPGQHPFTIHFFDPKFQQMQRSWFRALLQTKNPYDKGRTLAKNPALANVELVNEDSFFFWTFNYDNVPTPYMQNLESRFGHWLVKKYGSLDETLKKWNKRIDKDAPTQGRMGFIGLWEMANSRDARSQDTVRFLAEVQREYFDQMRDFVKRDLGYGGLVSASNWTTASERYLHPVDHWTNLSGDIMDSHGYFDVPRQKKNPAFGPAVGDLFADRALVRLDPDNLDKPVRTFAFPFLDYAFAGRPGMVSETAWNQPNRFRAEGPLLMAALGAQSGLDVQTGFDFDTPGFATNAMEYWPGASPTDIGQSPLASIIFRRGLIAETEPVAYISANKDDILGLKGAPTFGDNLGDFIRSSAVPTVSDDAIAAVIGGEVTPKQEFNPALFAAGKVVLDIGEKPSGMTISPKVSEWVRPETGEVRGASGGFIWNTKAGLFTLKAPKVQGAVGFLRDAGTLDLPALRLQSKMDFGVVAAVALDDLPLSKSKRILLQVMSEQKNTGWIQEGSPMGEVKQLGSPPIIVREFDAQVTFKRPDAAQMMVSALDWNGRKAKTLGNAVSFALLPDAAYYLIEAR